MDNLNLKNLLLSYQAVYDDTLCESMEELGLIGEARDGYGGDRSFTQDTDAASFRPGKDVPKVKKFGRIFKAIPHGIGDHANKTRSRVATIVGKDPGAPRSEKLPQEKKKKRVIPSRFDKADFELWVNDLLHEGYDLSDYTWDEIYGLYEEDARVINTKTPYGMHRTVITPTGTRSTLRSPGGEPIDVTPRRHSAAKIPNPKEVNGDPRDAKRRRPKTLQASYDYYDLILSHLLDEGYANTVESAEAIMVNMSEEWVGDIVEGYKKLPIGKMIRQAGRKTEGQIGYPYDEDKIKKDINKMARVASRHSIAKGKGRVRGEGQAELNRRRGEN